MCFEIQMAFDVLVSPSSFLNCPGIAPNRSDALRPTLVLFEYMKAHTPCALQLSGR